MADIIADKVEELLARFNIRRPPVPVDKVAKKLNLILQASFSKADARDVSTGEPTPEAPRTIVDVLGTLDRLPLHIQARSEFECVGAKPLGEGFNGVPVKV
jgi:hypothetical protein